jgi:hypothetical protein
MLAARSHGLPVCLGKERRPVVSGVVYRIAELNLQSRQHYASFFKQQQQQQ